MYMLKLRKRRLRGDTIENSLNELEFVWKRNWLRRHWYTLHFLTKPWWWLTRNNFLPVCFCSLLLPSLMHSSLSSRQAEIVPISWTYHVPSTSPPLRQFLPPNPQPCFSWVSLHSSFIHSWSWHSSGESLWQPTPQRLVVLLCVFP